jgi:mono/diheme cytochrome c family protein
MTPNDVHFPLINGSARAALAIPPHRRAQKRAPRWGLPLLLAAAALAGPAARAQSPAATLDGLAREAAAASPAFGGFSAQRGAALFTQRQATSSCASCHTDDPRATGRHAVTQREIAPLAPSANPARFTQPEKVDKWFRRNCNDVLGRACSPQEKGDILAWLMSLK